MLPDLLRGRAAAAENGQPTHNTSVIWLYLSGGPSQLETFDPKPENSSEFRSVVGSVPTNVPGTRIGGLFPQVGRNMPTSWPSCGRLPIARRITPPPHTGS